MRARRRAITEDCMNHRRNFKQTTLYGILAPSKGLLVACDPVVGGMHRLCAALSSKLQGASAHGIMRLVEESPSTCISVMRVK